MPGLPELIIIFFVIVLIFGTTKIPKLFGAFGEGIKNFKKGIQNTDEIPEGDELSKMKSDAGEQAIKSPENKHGK